MLRLSSLLTDTEDKIAVLAKLLARKQEQWDHHDYVIQGRLLELEGLRDLLRNEMEWRKADARASS